MTLLPQILWAGAWLREAGTGFASVSGTLRSFGGGQPLAYDSSLFAEYGLRPRFTVGLDINDNLTSGGHVMGFVRFPLSAPERPLKLALDLGIGGHRRDKTWFAHYKTALSLGRGFATGSATGWVSVDAAVELRKGDADLLYKLDATFGLSPSERIKAMFSVESYSTGGNFGWAVIPAIGMRAFGDRFLTAGFEIKDTGQRSYGLKLGIWHWF
ncbi:MAG: hypothetical protein NXH82_01310 [Rhodobacteraceae bacterium]|nr:hypothetical protein [Paracoccaceae bacterium]